MAELRARRPGCRFRFGPRLAPPSARGPHWGTGLLGTTAARLGESDLFAVQALADIATIAILQQRTVQQTLTAKDQLQTALSSRVAIEQAKGILSERYGVPMDASFHQLRSYARNHNIRLHEVARGSSTAPLPLRRPVWQRIRPFPNPTESTPPGGAARLDRSRPGSTDEREAVRRLAVMGAPRAGSES